MVPAYKLIVHLIRWGTLSVFDPAFASSTHFNILKAPKALKLLQNPIQFDKVNISLN